MCAARLLVAAALGLVAIATNAPAAAADAALRSALGAQLAPAGSRAGAHVVDLDTGQVLFSRGADRRLTPSSNEKIYTTGTALLRFGTGGHLRTTVLTPQPLSPTGAAKDKFHFTYPTAVWDALSTSGQEVSYGLTWALTQTAPPRTRSTHAPR